MAIRIFKQGVNVVIDNDGNANGQIITPAADMRFEVRSDILKLTDHRGSDRALNYPLDQVQDESGSGFANSQLLIDYLAEFVGSYNDCFDFQGIVDAIETLILCCQELDGNTDEIEAKLDSIITLITASNVSLDNIDQNTDNLETLLAAIDASIAATNVLITASNVSLDNIDNNTDNLEALQGTTNALLAGIDTVLDNILTCCGDSNTLLNAIANNTDGLEALITASNVLLTSLDGKDFATEVTLAAIKSTTDQISFVGDAMKVTAVITALPAGLATEAKQDTNISALASILAKIISAPSTEAKQDAIITAVGLLGTEATQLLIKAQTDKFTFTAGNLNVNATVNAGDSPFGDTGGYSNLTPDGSNQQVLAADSDFKEVILYHENKKTAWVKFGGGAAVIGEGFPIKKKEKIVLDKCRDEIRIIFENGFDTKELQINTIKL